MMEGREFLADDLYDHFPPTKPPPPIDPDWLAQFEAGRAQQLAKLPSLGGERCRRSADKMDRLIRRHERAALDMAAKPLTDWRHARLLNHTTIAARLCRVQATLRVLAGRHDDGTISRALGAIRNRAHVETALMFQEPELTALYESLDREVRK